METNAGTGEQAGAGHYPLSDISSAIEAELIERYEALHSSLAFFRTYRTVEGAWCYVARQPGRPPDILVFHHHGRRIDVLNEMISIEKSELSHFVQHIFDHFPDTGFIRFSALMTGLDAPGFPTQRYHSKDTFAISLPASPDEYLASIGKTTRTSIRHQMNTLKKVFPSFKLVCQVKGEVDSAAMGLIMKLSEDRINSRGSRFAHDASRIASLTRECGFVIQLLIDGRMCAGSINYRIGTSFFGDVTCFDPEFQRYGVGKLCTFLTICEAIRHGGRRFYLGGGEFDFKERMLGRRVSMDELQIFRSRSTMLRNLDWVFHCFAVGHMRRINNQLRQRKNSLIAKIAFGALQIYKNRTARK